MLPGFAYMCEGVGACEYKIIYMNVHEDSYIYVYIHIYIYIYIYIYKLFAALWVLPGFAFMCEDEGICAYKIIYMNVHEDSYINVYVHVYIYVYIYIFFEYT